MKYEEPILRDLGNLGLLVEFGDEADLTLSFTVIQLTQRIRGARLEGVHDVVPTVRSLAVFFDPRATSRGRLRHSIAELVEDRAGASSLRSRVLRIPLWYDDPWSAEVAERYAVEHNISFVARSNGLSVPELIDAHSSTDYWVTAVGFSPGTYFSYPLDFTNTISAPKYKNPRDWSPDRTICLAGRCTADYPVESPGGYQLIGRTPLDLYDPSQSNPIFRNDPVLARAGDRHRYVPIQEEEYHEIRARVESGDYEYEVFDEEFNADDWTHRRDSWHTRQDRPTTPGRGA